MIFTDARSRHLFPLCHALVILLDQVVADLAATVTVVIELGIDSFLGTRKSQQNFLLRSVLTLLKSKQTLPYLRYLFQDFQYCLLCLGHFLIPNPSIAVKTAGGNLL